MVCNMDVIVLNQAKLVTLQRIRPYVRLARISYQIAINVLLPQLLLNGDTVF